MWHTRAQHGREACSQIIKRKESDNKIKASPHSLSHNEQHLQQWQDSDRWKHWREFSLDSHMKFLRQPGKNCKEDRLSPRFGNPKVKSQQSSINYIVKWYFDFGWWKWNRLTASTTWYPLKVRAEGTPQAGPPGSQASLAESSPAETHSISFWKISVKAFICFTCSFTAYNL